MQGLLDNPKPLDVGAGPGNVFELPWAPTANQSWLDSTTDSRGAAFHSIR